MGGAGIIRSQWVHGSLGACPQKVFIPRVLPIDTRPFSASQLCHVTSLLYLLCHCPLQPSLDAKPMGPADVGLELNKLTCCRHLINTLKCRKHIEYRNQTTAFVHGKLMGGKPMGFLSTTANHSDLPTMVNIRFNHR